jgi:hypothetical protein
MAIDNQFGKGIGVAAGFDLGAKKPLDARIAVNTIAERDAHVDNNRAYEGMVVFVDETKKSYQLINGVWVELLKAEQDRLAALEAMLNGEGEGAEGGALATLQDNIDAVQDNLDKAVEDIEKAMENEAARVDQKIADDIAAESALRVAEEQRIEKEYKEAIAQEVKDRNAAIDDEKQRAEAKEGELAQAITKALQDAKDYADQKDTADKEAQSKFDAAQNSRIDALEAANAEGGAVKKAIDQVAQDLADFEAAQATKEQAQDNKDAALQKAIEDEASRADTEEKRIVGLVEAEKSAREAADNALDARLDVIEGEGEGSVKKALADAKAYTDEKIEEVNGAAEDLKARVKANEDALIIVNGEATVAGSIKKAQADAEAKAAELDAALKTELQKEIDDDVKVEKQRAEGKEGELAQAIADEVARADAAEKANAAEMTKQKDANQEGTLANKIAANAAAIAQEVADRTAAVSEEATARANADTALDNRLKDVEVAIGKDGALEARVAANEDALAGLEKDTVQASIDQAEADAKKYADDAITALVDSAPDAMNTLNELAKAISDHGDVYEAYVEEHATAMATMKSDLQKEIDADVKVVADELAKQKDDAQEGTLANKIKAEATRAEAAEKANKAAIDELIDTVGHDVLKGEIGETIEGASGLVARIIANETFVADQPAIDQEQDRRLKELEAFKTAMGEESEGLDERIDALELFVNGKEAEEGVPAVKSVDQKIAEAEAAAKGHADTKDTALHATIKAEMAAVIQSLAVGIVDGKLRVALGGIEGDDVLVIREQEIDFVTDDEIDAIIAGLDE